jgi:minor curlin subunit
MNFSALATALLSAAVSSLFATAAMGQTASEVTTMDPNYTVSSSLTDISAYTYNAAAPVIQGSNTSTVTQNGNLNSANAKMTATLGGSYYGNTTRQTQTGDNNSSMINAVGNSNALLATQQTGNGNISSVSAYGDSNTLTATQNGDHNSATIAAYGSGNSYSTTQTGNGLSVNLTQVGNGKSISITQTR